MELTPAERIRAYLVSVETGMMSKQHASQVRNLKRIVEHLLEGCERLVIPSCDVLLPANRNATVAFTASQAIEAAAKVLEDK